MKWTLQLVNNAVFLAVIHDTRLTLCSCDTTTHILHTYITSSQLKLYCKNRCWVAHYNASLFLVCVEPGGVERDGRQTSAAMTEWSQDPSGCPILAFPGILTRRVRVWRSRRSRCVKDICHNICDLLAVCHPLCSDGPLPVLLFLWATNAALAHIC